MDSRSLRQQGLCFILGMAVFLPLGLLSVSRAQSAIEVLLGEGTPAISATPSSSSPAAVEPEPKRRFLAVNTKKSLSLYPLQSDGSVGSKPADVLDLSSIQDPGLGDFYQGSQLVVHPRLNVLYECSLDAAMKSLKVHSFSIQENGKLSPLGEPTRLALDSAVFRGTGFGIMASLDPSGNYLYLTQSSRGGATGQHPQIPFYRLNAQGRIESNPLSMKINLPANGFFSVSLEPGRPGSKDVYGFIAPCAAGASGSTAYHFAVQADGELKAESALSLSGGGVFRNQAAAGFLRNSTWGIWEGLQLDGQGGLVGAYAWPRPKSGEALYELTGGRALGISHSRNMTEARLFDLDPKNDHPVVSSLPVTAPRVYYEPGQTLTDAKTQQVLFFDENEKGLEVTRIGVQIGELRVWKPQVLGDCGSLTCSTGKVQVISVH